MAEEVVLITGCATGIGRALAEEFHTRRNKDGSKAFKVFATDYRLEALKGLEEEGIATAKLDVTDGKSIKAAVDGVLGAAGRIDLLVCNAGMAVSGWMAEVNISDLERLFDVNVFGVFRCAQAVAPHMMDRRSGKIATFCSVNSWVCQPFGGTYAGSKAAVAMMTEALRVEVEPFGIQVTSVVPGWVKSQIMNSAVVDYDRYEHPDAQYNGVMYRVREHRDYMAKQGITTQKAASDIVQGLSKPKPPRYLYTGTWLIYSLGAGFIQTWISSNFIAKKLQKIYHLDKTEKLGRASLPKIQANGKGLPLSYRKEE